MTRRALLAAAGGFFAGEGRPQGSGAAAPLGQAAPTFTPPPGSCDAHVHVIGDPHIFPMSPDRDYTPPPATADDLERMLGRLRLDRVVIVAPTVYGADSSATVAAIARIGRDRARGVVFVDRTASVEALDAMKEAGVVGLRLFLASPDGRIDAAQSAERLRWAADLAAPRSWHLDISTPPDVIAAVANDLVASPVPIVLDYFGWAQGGVHQRGFDSIIDLLKSGHAYVKLSEPYRLSSDYPEYRDLTPVVRAYIAANPDRLLWGSGWPHVASGGNGRSRLELSPNLPVETARLLDLLAEWIPDISIRQKILVDNPARLYDFAST